MFFPLFGTSLLLLNVASAKPLKKSNQDIEFGKAIRELIYGTNSYPKNKKIIRNSELLTNGEKESIDQLFSKETNCNKLNGFKTIDGPLLTQLLTSRINICLNGDLFRSSFERKIKFLSEFPISISREIAQKSITLKKLSDTTLKEILESDQVAINIIGKDRLIKETQRRDISLHQTLLEQEFAAQTYKNEFSNTFNTVTTIAKGDEKQTLIEYITSALNFYLANINLIPKNYAAEKLLKTSHTLMLSGHEAIAQDILKIGKLNTDSELLTEFYFHMIASFLIRNDFEGADKYIVKSIDYKRFNDERLLFWIAKVFSQNDKVEESRELWRKIIDTGVYASYYDYLSAYHLNINEHPINNLAVDIKEVDDKLARRLDLWNKLGLEKLLEEEALYISLLSIKAKNNLALNTIQQILSQNKKFLSLFKMANILETQRYKDFSIQRKNLFPFEFHQNVVELNKTKIDPMLVMALIRQESAFNINAESPVGALGLMQIMPATGKQIDRKSSPKVLRTPQKNIKIGIQYLDYLIKKFNSIPEALAAYNAGPNRVISWKNNLNRGNEMLLQVELIPFKETRNYVKYIFRNFASYKMTTNNDSIKEITEKFFGVSNI